MAIIYAWSGCLRKRGELDASPEVIVFAEKLEEAAIATIESGIMTGDLFLTADTNPNNKRVSTGTFINVIAENLRNSLNG